MVDYDVRVIGGGTGTVVEDAFAVISLEYTGGCTFVKIFPTQGWRTTAVWDSHQYRSPSDSGAPDTDRCSNLPVRDDPGVGVCRK